MAQPQPDLVGHLAGRQLHRRLDPAVLGVRYDLVLQRAEVCRQVLHRNLPALRQPRPRGGTRQPKAAALFHHQQVAETFQERGLFKRFVGGTARRVLVERVRADHDVDGILVVERAQKTRHVVPLQVDVRRAFDPALVVPTCVGEPVLLRIVARSPHRQPVMLQQQPVLQHVDETSGTRIAGRQQARHVDQVYAAADDVGVEPGRVFWAAVGGRYAAARRAAHVGSGRKKRAVGSVTHSDDGREYKGLRHRGQNVLGVGVGLRRVLPTGFGIQVGGGLGVMAQSEPVIGIAFVP